MRRIAALTALLGCSMIAAAVALGGPPRLEQKRLRAADMALAQQITLRKSDLAAGWLRQPPPKFPDELPRCPGVDLDFSAFTITGRAQSTFTRGLAAVHAVVEVFETRADAVSDFRKGSNPKLLRCSAHELRRQGITIASARIMRRPRVGERALEFRVILSNAGGRFYMDMVGVQRGRSIIGLYFTDTKPITGRLAVARALAARAR